MKCPHSIRETPATCSQCLQAAGTLPVPVQRVDVVGGAVHVDGVKVRETVERIDPERRFGGWK